MQQVRTALSDHGLRGSSTLFDLSLRLTPKRRDNMCSPSPGSIPPTQHHDDQRPVAFAGRCDRLLVTDRGVPLFRTRAHPHTDTPQVSAVLFSHPVQPVSIDPPDVDLQSTRQVHFSAATAATPAARRR
jgi:hypothetical protein